MRSDGSGVIEDDSGDEPHPDIRRASDLRPLPGTDASAQVINFLEIPTRK